MTGCLNSASDLDHYWQPALVQDNDQEEAAMKLTAVPVALVRPATDGETVALAAGSAFPVVASSDEEDAVALLQDSLQTAIAASPALEGALLPLARCPIGINTRCWRLPELYACCRARNTQTHCLTRLPFRCSLRNHVAYH